jgi:hypothetical protein
MKKVSNVLLYEERSCSTVEARASPASRGRMAAVGGVEAASSFAVIASYPRLAGSARPGEAR